MCVGCATDAPPPSIQTRVSGGPRQSDSDRASASVSNVAVAEINGTAIPRGPFLKSLVEGHGLALLQRWAMRESAVQEAGRLGLKITADDVRRETDRQLEAGWGEKSAAGMTDQQREGLIGAYLRLRGLCRFELDLVMERDACLRKIAEQRIEPTDEQIRDEYKRQYGERVQVRYLQLPALRFWEPIRQQLDRGADFGELAKLHSTHEASRDAGGLLAAFSRDDLFLPRAFIDVAFALQPGQVSNPLNYEGACHVLKLEERFPAREVAFGGRGFQPLNPDSAAGSRSHEGVRQEVRHTLMDRLVRDEIQRLTETLWMQCRLRIDDPVLRTQYQRRVNSGELRGPALAED